METGERILLLLGKLILIWVATSAAITVLMTMLLPRGSRLSALPTVFPSVLFGLLRRPRWTWKSEDRAAAGSRSVGLVMNWNSLEIREDLVKERRCITIEGQAAEVFGIDLDGTVLVSQSLADDDGYKLYLRRPDDSLTVIAQGGPHASGWATGGSVDRGAAAWVRWNRNDRVLELWRWDESVGDRVIHRTDVPAKTRRAAPGGWALVLGDVTVATLLHDIVGKVVAHHPEFGAVDVGATAWPTLHRDLGYEERGQRVAAFSLHKGGPIPNRVATLDVDQWPPRVTELGAGYEPGASTVLGLVVGAWSKPVLLEVPVDQGLQLDDGVLVDPVGDHSWVAFTHARPSRWAPRRLAKRALLTDGTRGQILSDRAEGRILIRGEFICWQEAEPRSVADPGTPYLGTTSWVALLCRYETPEPPREPTGQPFSGQE